MLSYYSSLEPLLLSSPLLSPLLSLLLLVCPLLPYCLLLLVGREGGRGERGVARGQTREQQEGKGGGRTWVVGARVVP